MRRAKREPARRGWLGYEVDQQAVKAAMLDLVTGASRPQRASKGWNHPFGIASNRMVIATFHCTHGCPLKLPQTGATIKLASWPLVVTVRSAPLRRPASP